MGKGVCYNETINAKGNHNMKRWISILLAVCLLMGGAALAQDDGAEKLPAPEVVAELNDVDETADETVEETEVSAEDADAPEAEDIPETESTEQPVEAGEDFELWFEEGFSLTLPEGWVSYAVSDLDRAGGVRYALGDGSGERSLYIQFTDTSIKDVGALSEAVEATDGLNQTGDLNFGGVDFVAFIDATQNASSCATILNGMLTVFVFTPQTDSDFMLTASRVMESFNVL